jgi:hypothetical protein
MNGNLHLLAEREESKSSEDESSKVAGKIGCTMGTQLDSCQPASLAAGALQMEAIQRRSSCLRTATTWKDAGIGQQEMISFEKR